jgi:hypothetical protein
MTTIEVITKKQYEEQIEGKVGSFIFPSEWYDCSHNVDMNKLKKNIKDLLPKGKKIDKVLITTDENPRYKNVANPLIPYIYVSCADQTTDGAFYYTSNHGFKMWATMFPVGDAIIVLK